MAIITAHDPTPPALELRHASASVAKWLIICCLVLFVAITILQDPVIISAKAWSAAWLLLFAAPIVIFILLRRLLRSGLQLRIDQSGILHPPFRDQPIPWEDVASVTLTRAFANSQLGMRLTQAAREREPRANGLRARLERKLSGLDLSITLTTMDHPPEAVMRAIHLHSGGRL